MECGRRVCLRWSGGLVAQGAFRSPGLDRGAGAVVRDRSRAGGGALIFQQGGAGGVVGDGSLLVVAGRAAESFGLGSRGRLARWRWPSERCLGVVLWPAAGGLALLRARRSGGQGRRRAAGGIHGDELRARAAVRERARLPAAARRLV